MRKGFTLIELMIVIAIIAIIAAIAIPNLLESRITANEANAATSLKSGLFPGQTQFQAGGYVDVDNDGRGTFAAHPAHLAGDVTAAGTAITALGMAPSKPLSLIDPKFNNVSGKIGVPGITSSIVGGAANENSANAGAYDFIFLTNTTGAPVANFNGDLSASAEDDAESYWGGVACPKNTSGSEGRRAFAVNVTGSVFQSKGDLELTNTQIASIIASFGQGDANQIFFKDPRVNVAEPNPTAQGGSTPFQK